ncbi:RNA 3'-terminal phosphate cyclase [Candidatus Woesearchaeota archaeon]|nr:RNA 3'-terminal phosphate cyclase [Candidatus Woesearchaeota archaeon]
MLTIDGSYGEGGGAILRMALALSSITFQSFEIVNIRKGRPNPGLQPQHLACVRALEEFCNASSEGAAIGSTSVKFFPGKPQSRTLSVDIGTAGSVTLLLQALLLPALFAPGKVRLKLTGGTNVSHSQPAEYFSSVFLPQIARFGSCSFSLLQRGYFPKGNGKVELDIRPDFHLGDYDTFADLRKALSQQLQIGESPIAHSAASGIVPGISMFERGKLLKITGVSHASSDLKSAEVAERQAHSAKISVSQQLQKQNIACPILIQAEYSNSLSTGSGISLFAHFAAAGKDEPGQTSPVILGSDSLGERGKMAEVVGQEAASALAKEISSGACVDRYLADQLIPFMAITGNGKIITSEITNHCLTNIFVVERFLGKIFEADNEKKIVKSL